MTSKQPELLAPAGNWDCAKAAIENGADAIYFGLDRFNARMRAQNFTEADLPKLMEFLHRRGVKGYVTVNTLIFPQELTEAEQYLRTIIAAGVDAVIVQDVGICRLIRHLSPNFPIHASTQMTITSAAGVEFAKSLGCQLVVLARECSLEEIDKIQRQLNKTETSLPLEVFVHGALCVAYSGQCLTSEALGGRSANRGECAQACRMPYELISDGEIVDLGNRRYLLSPQDLAGLEVLPDLVKAGITCLKIEGRLKTPEYVANVTRVYREALDKVIVDIYPTPALTQGNRARFVNEGWGNQERYNLEMAFSRGLYTGWFGGINNQELVHARFGKKRGVYLGEVTSIRNEQIRVLLQAPIKPGDGVVFDSGHPEAQEEGGRVYSVEMRGHEAVLIFGRRDLNLRRIHVGDRVWKTSDPELDRQLRQSFSLENPQFLRPIYLEIYGELDQKLIAIARDELGHIVQVESANSLVEAHTKPLTTERLHEQFGRLGNTSFCLGSLTNHLEGNFMLPVSELNRMRREIVVQLEELRSACSSASLSQAKLWELNPNASLSNLLPSVVKTQNNCDSLSLIVLVRNLQQLKAAFQAGVDTLYCEFEDPRAYREAVEIVHQQGKHNETRPNIWVAPPRITKPGENWILQQVRSCNADGYLVRNYDHLKFFAQERCIGDFSLNVANPLTADYFKHRFNLERLTASYDLNITQLEDLLTSCSPNWFEVTIHQHMPMFHMEHCVFCAFLSNGTDYTNCGRPCEKHEVKLRDRVGTEHILQADTGCRNTVFNGTAQTGAEYVQRLVELGLQHLRIEFLNESPEQVHQTIDCYRQLLQGKITGVQLWRKLKLQNQLGVTRGSLG
ncbi:U32 family peptidase [Aetokthonos hydrillicola Thurmond2011]|jgi:putative protease|uniref:U32 family peptidase n=1 Tax=Aetokthonos hydrillicola Thurmond2011 TaxID=2712845 RepID=A0AAP5IGE1_9CYAN|nr:U32 family peptidase [Aetokthonos hydrillicola]MBO3457162.1 U32 family peptidase [Aetokthonos hydrillicola CCALA 1050]MBW4587513.1 U32 family peptidase [Aetokthonos hydrillicola CCALA 1050]MDR9898620.1 U32 family peptidase [Aetokthonos hydrillicola Thurmond2011]